MNRKERRWRERQKLWIAVGRKEKQFVKPMFRIVVTTVEGQPSVLLEGAVLRKEFADQIVRLFYGFQEDGEPHEWVQAAQVGEVQE